MKALDSLDRWFLGRLQEDKLCGAILQGEPRLLHGCEAIVSSPRLVMPACIFRELAYYFSSVPREMQVLGVVEKDENNVFTISGLEVPPHSAGFDWAVLNQDLFPAWLTKLEREGKKTEFRLQGHSHGSLDSYFSPEDINTIRNAYSCDWVISLVGNRHCVFLARLDIFEPIPVSIALPIIVEFSGLPFSEEEKELWACKLKDASSFRQKGGADNG